MATSCCGSLTTCRNISKLSHSPHTHVHVRTHVYARANTCAHVHVRTHMQASTCGTHTHMHTSLYTVEALNDLV